MGQIPRSTERILVSATTASAVAVAAVVNVMVVVDMTDR